MLSHFLRPRIDFFVRWGDNTPEALSRKVKQTKSATTCSQILVCEFHLDVLIFGLCLFTSALSVICHREYIIELKTYLSCFSNPLLFYYL